MAFHALEQLSRLHDGYMKAFQVERLKLLLIHEAGKTYLIENRCPHMDVPLTMGQLLPEGKIRCMAHGIEFDLGSGKAGGPLADTLDCLQHFKLAYEGSSVGVEL
ncbi:Rieske (2Fe-2S) protein [Agaribacterium haliotis]|uniref:Rieske (2Fe-2S) protein n=1 Tax=Agaribacterium haliotis TaxID=2013869 RepID=UPI000BB538EB|nr:Rieske 2Fe-2S domain-containing protein [Agaribacterium haliotis]